MGTPGKLHVDTATGHLTGAARIEYNRPFPCVNGSYGSGAMSGVLMHTMVGNLTGTVAWFNNPAANASAHFGIGQDGTVHQFGPVGKGWMAWHAAAANHAWYGIEHADNGNPDNPLTAAQMAASAQVVECLSAFAGFPLQQTDSPAKDGYGVHFMGGLPWGGHSCPDSPPQHVRSRQRGEILRIAHLIRDPAVPKPSRHVVAAPITLADLCDREKHAIAATVWETAHNEPGGFGPLFSAYLSKGDLHADMDPGTVVWFPA